MHPTPPRTFGVYVNRVQPGERYCFVSISVPWYLLMALPRPVTRLDVAQLLTSALSAHQGVVLERLESSRAQVAQDG